MPWLSSTPAADNDEADHIVTPLQAVAAHEAACRARTSSRIRGPRTIEQMLETPTGADTTATPRRRATIARASAEVGAALSRGGHQRR